MEKQVLKYLDYKLKIDKREYALSYFKLRKYIKKNIKSYQNRKLNIKLIRELQNGVRNEYKTNFLTKRNSFWELKSYFLKSFMLFYQLYTILRILFVHQF